MVTTGQSSLPHPPEHASALGDNPAQPGEGTSVQVVGSAGAALSPAGNTEPEPENKTEEEKTTLPTPSQEGWSEDDDRRLFSLFKLRGSKWSLYRDDFPGKTENQIKNRFYSTLRRVATRERNAQSSLVSQSGQKVDLLQYVDKAFDSGHSCYSKRGRKRKLATPRSDRHPEPNPTSEANLKAEPKPEPVPLLAQTAPAPPQSRPNPEREPEAKVAPPAKIESRPATSWEGTHKVVQIISEHSLPVQETVSESTRLEQRRRRLIEKNDEAIASAQRLLANFPPSQAARHLQLEELRNLKEGIEILLGLTSREVQRRGQPDPLQPLGYHTPSCCQLYFSFRLKESFFN